MCVDVFLGHFGKFPLECLPSRETTKFFSIFSFRTFRSTFEIEAFQVYWLLFVQFFDLSVKTDGILLPKQLAYACWPMRIENNNGDSGRTAVVTISDIGEEQLNRTPVSAQMWQTRFEQYSDDVIRGVQGH